jgi:DNA-binding MarR family transcriptional regulator
MMVVSMVKQEPRAAQAATPGPSSAAATEFFKSLSLLEQAHRRLLEVVKDELERTGEHALTGVQALLIYEIGQENGGSQASALRQRGAFAGTSLSYNVKKLEEAGYLIQSRSAADRRTALLKLTKSGETIRDRVRTLFQRQALALEPSASVRSDDLQSFNRTATRLERFWSDQIRYRL